MREFEARWLLRGEPIPEGWELAANDQRMRDHHGHYARLIVRELSPEEIEKEGRDGGAVSNG